MNWVLVTGAAGFIGEQVTQKFVAEGWYVIALIHKKQSPALQLLEEKKLITCIQGDIGDAKMLLQQLTKILTERRISLQAIVHCAAYVSDVGYRRQFAKINYLAVSALAQIAETLGSKFIFMSTTDVYGIKDFKGEAEDDLPLCNNRNNNYPRYKIAAEKWLKNNFPAKQYVIIRPAAVWGLYDETLTKRIVDFLRWSPFIVHFGKWCGKNRWPLAHVKNVATAAFIATVNDNALGKEINVLDNERTSVDEFYSILIEIFFPQKKYRRIYLPLWLILPWAWLITKISNLFNLKKPFIDPSFYALFSVSSNLDFSNKLFVQLAQEKQQTIFSYAQGVAELKLGRYL
jgi:nucleoside-diphosphate-sugar epimerase